MIKLDLLIEGTSSGFSIYGYPGVVDFLENLEEADVVATTALFNRISKHGIPKNKQKSNPEGDELFALKPKQIRLIYFYDPNRRRIIIVTHCYVKKSQKMPRKDFAKAKNIKGRIAEAFERGFLKYE